VENEVRNEVVNLCSNFPIYKNLNKWSAQYVRKVRLQS
jgi:replication initiation and membrane attachment protein DnaB